jgi:hypothetical protein
MDNIYMYASCSKEQSHFICNTGLLRLQLTFSNSGKQVVVTVPLGLQNGIHLWHIHKFRQKSSRLIQWMTSAPADQMTATAGQSEILNWQVTSVWVVHVLATTRTCVSMCIGSFFSTCRLACQQLLLSCHVIMSLTC